MNRHGFDALRGASSEFFRVQLVCPLPGCNMQAPSIKNMEMHHASKHPKVPFDPSIYIDAQALHGGESAWITAVMRGP